MTVNLSDSNAQALQGVFNSSSNKSAGSNFLGL